MTPWLVRGVVMALVHFVARTLLALGIASAPTQGSILRPLTLIVVILVAVVWGGIDGINDRRAHPDPDASADFTMTWLKASVVAGLLSGLVTWIFSALFNVVVTSNSLIFEVTSGAAFTILLVFIPAMLAVSLGRLLAGRDAKKNQSDDDRPVARERQHAHSGAAQGGAATGYTPARSADTDYYSQSPHEDRDFQQDDYDSSARSESDTEVFEPVPTESTTGDVPNLTKAAESRDTWQEPR